MFPPPNRLISVWLRVATLIGGVLLISVTTEAQSLPGFQAPQTQKVSDNTPREIKAARGEAPMRQAYPELKVSNAKITRLARLTKREEKGKRDKLLHVGVVRPLKTPLNPLTNGDAHVVQSGIVRVMGVISSGAIGVRVQFKDMSLPVGGRVFVYSLSNPEEYYGPFEGRGTFDNGTLWAPPVSGEGIAIEYFEPSGTKSTDFPFQVSQIAHIYKDVSAAAGACNPDVTPEWANVAKSVAMLQFITGPYVALCTGTLLNDSNPSVDHYVLTANHCISTQSEAQSVFAFWKYDSGENPGGVVSSGFLLTVTGSPSDFTLLWAYQIPSGLYFSGWDASPLGMSTAVTGIHHPSGSHKRIAFGTTNADCLFLPCADFAGLTWSQGTTEPGSSGSGLWTGTPDNAKLVGTLTGGQASCANLSASDYYGRFSVSYPAMASFLQGTNCVTSATSTIQNVSEAGGTGTVTVTAPAGCSWTAVAIEDFVSITGNANGTGNGSITFTMAANNGPQRFGSIVIGGQVFKVFQMGGGPCAAMPIVLGQTINGNLSTGDCPLGDGTYYDVYSINGTAGERLSVSMSSSEFDAYLFLNHPNGSNLYQDDDGGGGTNSRIPAVSDYITLPVTGTYTIWANAFDPAHATGNYSLTLGEQPRGTLTILSTGTGSSLNVSVWRSDLDGLSNGSTPFTRTYYQNNFVGLEVPSVVGGNILGEWQKDGVHFTSNTVASVYVDGNHTMTAVYRPPQHYVINVDASNAGGGVLIYPYQRLDDNGLGVGTTPFTRNYTEGTGAPYVGFDAPPIAPNGNRFQKWQEDGVDISTSTLTYIDLNGNHTLTAIYAPPTWFTVTINSSNPNSGVNMTVQPPDKEGLRDGVTPFVRTYLKGSFVQVTPPLQANGNAFQKWVVNGSDSPSAYPISFDVTDNVTLTAVYMPAPPRTLTVQSRHPDTGVAIMSIPNDNNGMGSGITSFTRTYGLYTTVTLTAPATVGQNTFVAWRQGTGAAWFSPSMVVIMQFDTTLTAEYLPGPPAVWTEHGTNNVAAINSVTYLRGPFQILDSHNFSTDGHTRIILLTSDLELAQQQNPDPAVITVQAAGVNLPVENVGPFTGASGASGSYVIVKLPDGLPSGNLSLTLTLRGLTSIATTLPVLP